MLGEEVKNGTAAIYYISPFELKSPMCEMWVFPIDIEKGFMSKAKQEYATTAYRVNFFFNYDPGRPVPRGRPRARCLRTRCSCRPAGSGSTTR